MILNKQIFTSYILNDNLRNYYIFFGLLIIVGYLVLPAVLFFFWLVTLLILFLRMGRVFILTQILNFNSNTFYMINRFYGLANLNTYSYVLQNDSLKEKNKVNFNSNTSGK